MAKQTGGWVPSGITWRLQRPPLFSSGILITENETPIWLSCCSQIAVYTQPKAILTAPGYGWRLGNQSVEDVHIQIFIHLFSKYFLSACCVPHTVPGWEDTQNIGLDDGQSAQTPLVEDQHRHTGPHSCIAVLGEKADRNPNPHGAYILVWGAKQ